jgi:hypothetical protein
MPGPYVVAPLVLAMTAPGHARVRHTYVSTPGVSARRALTYPCPFDLLLLRLTMWMAWAHWVQGVMTGPTYAA